MARWFLNKAWAIGIASIMLGSILFLIGCKPQDNKHLRQVVSDAMLLAQTGQEDSAAVLLFQLNPLSVRTTQDSIRFGSSQVGLAGWLWEQQDYEQAALLFSFGFPYYQAIQDSTYYLDQVRRFGETLSDAERWKESLQVYSQGIYLAKLRQDSLEERRLLESLSLLHEKVPASVFKDLMVRPQVQQQRLIPMKAGIIMALIPALISGFIVYLSMTYLSKKKK